MALLTMCGGVVVAGVGPAEAARCYDPVVTPTSHSFGSVAVGDQSAEFDFTVGGSLLPCPIGNLTTVLTPGSAFHVLDGHPCASGYGNQCTVAVAFEPTTLGAAQDTLTINESGFGLSYSVSLTGTAVASAKLTPTTHSFGKVPAGNSSPEYDFTVGNAGHTAVPLSAGVTANTPFALAGGTCAGSVPAEHGTCTIGVVFQPTDTGPFTAVLSVTVPSGTLTARLSGTGTAAATLAPTGHAFGKLPTGNVSPEFDFTVTNRGQSAVPIAVALTSGSGFGLSGGTCGGSVPAALGSCTIGVVFEPGHAGSYSDTLTVQTPSGTLSAKVSGIGSASATLSPTSHSFGTLNAGTSSPEFDFTVTNTGQAVEPISIDVTAGTPFARSGGTCGSSVPSLGTCTIGIVFSPDDAGSFSGTLSVATPGGLLTVLLKGAGRAVATLTPTATDYGTVAAGSSASFTFTVHNAEVAAQPLGPITTSGAPFSVVGGSCGTVLAANYASCTVVVQFAPTVAGAATGTLTVPVRGTTLTAALSGSGSGSVGAVTLTPATHDFGVVQRGTQSAAFDYTLSNSTGSSIALQNVAATTGQQFFPTGSTCTPTVAAGASCTISVVFQPWANSPTSDTITVTTSGGSPSATMSGTGVDPLAVTPTTHDFGSVAVGDVSAPYDFTVTNNGAAATGIDPTPGLDGDFESTGSGTCAGLSSLDPGQSCTMSIRFRPTATGSRPGALHVEHGVLENSMYWVNATLTGTGTSSTTPPPPSSTRVSVSSSGAQTDIGDTGRSSVSADGRYVVFSSSATTLVSGDTNGTDDVFLRDVESGTTTRVSVASDGTQANGVSLNPSISADGRYVLFESQATNLAGADANGTANDVYLHDNQTGATTRVDVSSSGVQGNGQADEAAISPTGRFVTFESNATNLVPGVHPVAAQLYLRDLQAGTTEVVSVSTGGVVGDQASGSSSISSDGRYVVFDTSATDLSGADTNDDTDVYLRDRVAGTTTLVSTGPSGVGDGTSDLPQISSDGSVIVFESYATNLRTGGTDTNGFKDIYATRTASIGTNYLISTAADGTQANGPNEAPAVSVQPGGVVIAYSDIYANNHLVPDDPLFAGVYTAWFPGGDLSQHPHVAAAGLDALDAALSADGGTVTFSTRRPLDPQDTNDLWDLYQTTVDES